jgi:stage II sporulation protein AA (anti-sigma F factor antagonist)
MSKQKIEFNLPANLLFSAITRSLADEIFNYVGFSKEWCSRLKLVVDELFMNAVKYGSTENKSIVHIVFTYDDKEIEFKIDDDGTGSQKTTVDDLKAVILKNANHNDLTKTSGRGLAMITQIWTDQMNIEKSPYGGISMFFVKKIEKTSPPPPAIIQTVMTKPPKQTSSMVKEVQPAGPAFNIMLEGEIDPINIDKLAMPIAEKIDNMPQGGRLVLDFTHLNYINSTFIGHLASWYKQVQKNGGQIALKNTNEQILDVLDLVGLKRVLIIE